MSPSLTKEERAILACVREYPGIGENRIAFRTGLPQALVSHYVAKLRAAGRLVRSGS